MPKYWFAQEAERGGERGLEITGPADEADVQGHPWKFVSPDDADDTAGHPWRWVSPEGAEDVEGHPWRFIEAEGEPGKYLVEMETGEDVTGHWVKRGLAEGDVEGQGLTTRPPVD